jgi:arylsulfatase A-like enzyme
MHDTLRPDRLDFHGNPTAASPFLGRIARAGVLFTEGLSTSSWTAPATASLMTSLYPTQHGVMTGFFLHRRRTEAAGKDTTEVNRLPDAVATWPELLREAGYRTFGIGANINIGPEIGFDRGFDRFVRLKTPRWNRKDDEESREPGPTDGGRGKRSAEASAEGVLAKFLEWEGEILSSEPYFLYLHFNDMHRPYTPRAPWFVPPARADHRDLAAYDSEITYADRVIQRIHRRLDPDDDDVLLVVSDHGEAFGEHGIHGHPKGLHRVLNRVLFLAAAPRRDGFAAIRRDPVSLIDVFPTIFETAGLPVPSGREGRSVRTGAERPVFAHRRPLAPGRTDTWAVVVGGWKATREAGVWSLYDLTSDPGERTDLAEDHPRLLSRMQAALADFEARSEALPSETVEVELGEERKDALRALGYVD